MRAISLWQPWATAVALGAKRIETRHWATGYRGPLAIHAARRLKKTELIDFASSWNWCGALGRQMKDPTLAGGPPPLWETLPFGAVVAVCRLVACRPTRAFTDIEIDQPRRPDGLFPSIREWTEREMGNFDHGRFGWVLEDIRAMPEPIPCIGRQGFFEIDDALFGPGYFSPAPDLLDRSRGAQIPA